jgi:peptide/nickel transport system substrate-binding protein
MNGSRLRFALASVLATAAFGAAACGDDDKDKAPSSGSSGTPATKETQKAGGTLKVQTSSDTDFLDPGHTYYTLGFAVEYAISTPLYYFKPGSTESVPFLADGEPEISSDSKTITVKIKKGWMFGPPVNRAVTSKDVKYAFERFFSSNVGGQYPGYFQVIEGAPKKPTDGVKPISGITTPDDNTLVIKLTQPVAVATVAALVMPITIPVPEEYASKFDAKSPSTYNTHVVSSGPYMIKADSSGSLTGYKAGKSIQLVRNPNWKGKEWGDPRPAYVDAISMRTNATDANVSSRQILDGASTISLENPPANILREVITKIKDQFSSYPAGSFRYFPLNTTVKPFDDLNVRKAVLAGFDREAARKARGGKYIGPIATHFLPPDFPGHEESGGLAGFGFDYFSDKNTKGDLAVAAKYFKAAGYASGKYEGDEEILMVGSNSDPGKAQSEVAADQLKKMGFKVRLRLVPQDSVYTEWCQVPSKNVGMCGGASWGKDFYDPQSMIEPLFKGSLINPKSGNINYSELNDKELDALMDKAALSTGDQRIQDWVAVNKKVVEDAAAIPFIWDTQTVLRSKNVVGTDETAVQPYTGLWDLSYLSLK